MASSLLPTKKNRVVYQFFKPSIKGSIRQLTALRMVRASIPAKKSFSKRFLQH